MSNRSYSHVRQDTFNGTKPRVINNTPDFDMINAVRLNTAPIDIRDLHPDHHNPVNSINSDIFKESSNSKPPSSSRPQTSLHLALNSNSRRRSFGDDITYPMSRSSSVTSRPSSPAPYDVYPNTSELYLTPNGTQSQTPHNLVAPSPQATQRAFLAQISESAGSMYLRRNSFGPEPFEPEPEPQHPEYTSTSEHPSRPKPVISRSNSRQSLHDSRYRSGSTASTRNQSQRDSLRQIPSSSVRGRSVGGASTRLTSLTRTQPTRISATPVTTPRRHNSIPRSTVRAESYGNRNDVGERGESVGRTAFRTESTGRGESRLAYSRQHTQNEDNERYPYSANSNQFESKPIYTRTTNRPQSAGSRSFSTSSSNRNVYADNIFNVINTDSRTLKDNLQTNINPNLTVTTPRKQLSSTYGQSRLASRPDLRQDSSLRSSSRSLSSVTNTRPTSSQTTFNARPSSYSNKLYGDVTSRVDSGLTRTRDASQSSQYSQHATAQQNVENTQPSVHRLTHSSVSGNNMSGTNGRSSSVASRVGTANKRELDDYDRARQYSMRAQSSIRPVEHSREEEDNDRVKRHRQEYYQSPQSKKHSSQTNRVFFAQASDDEDSDEFQDPLPIPSPDVRLVPSTAPNQDSVNPQPSRSVSRPRYTYIMADSDEEADTSISKFSQTDTPVYTPHKEIYSPGHSSPVYVSPRQAVLNRTTSPLSTLSHSSPSFSDHTSPSKRFEQHQFASETLNKIVSNSKNSPYRRSRQEVLEGTSTGRYTFRNVYDDLTPASSPQLQQQQQLINSTYVQPEISHLRSHSPSHFPTSTHSASHLPALPEPSPKYSFVSVLPEPDNEPHDSIRTPPRKAVRFQYISPSSHMSDSPYSTHPTPSVYSTSHSLPQPELTPELTQYSSPRSLSLSLSPRHSQSPHSSPIVRRASPTVYPGSPNARLNTNDASSPSARRASPTVYPGSPNSRLDNISSPSVRRASPTVYPGSPLNNSPNDYLSPRIHRVASPNIVVDAPHNQHTSSNDTISLSRSLSRPPALPLPNIPSTDAVSSIAYSPRQPVTNTNSSPSHSHISSVNTYTTNYTNQTTTSTVMKIGFINADIPPLEFTIDKPQSKSIFHTIMNNLSSLPSVMFKILPTPTEQTLNLPELADVDLLNIPELVPVLSLPPLSSVSAQSRRYQYGNLPLPPLIEGSESTSPIQPLSSTSYRSSFKSSSTSTRDDMDLSVSQFTTHKYHLNIDDTSSIGSLASPSLGNTHIATVNALNLASPSGKTPKKPTPLKTPMRSISPSSTSIRNRLQFDDARSEVSDMSVPLSSSSPPRIGYHAIRSLQHHQAQLEKQRLQKARTQNINQLQRDQEIAEQKELQAKQRDLASRIEAIGKEVEIAQQDMKNLSRPQSPSHLSPSHIVATDTLSDVSQLRESPHTLALTNVPSESALSVSNNVSIKPSRPAPPIPNTIQSQVVMGVMGVREELSKSDRVADKLSDIKERKLDLDKANIKIMNYIFEEIEKTSIIQEIMKYDSVSTNRVQVECSEEDVKRDIRSAIVNLVVGETASTPDDQSTHSSLTAYTTHSQSSVVEVYDDFLSRIDAHVRSLSNYDRLMYHQQQQQHITTNELHRQALANLQLVLASRLEGQTPRLNSTEEEIILQNVDVHMTKVAELVYACLDQINQQQQQVLKLAELKKQENLVSEVGSKYNEMKTMIDDQIQHIRAADLDVDTTTEKIKFFERARDRLNLREKELDQYKNELNTLEKTPLISDCFMNVMNALPGEFHDLLKSVDVQTTQVLNKKEEREKRERERQKSLQGTMKMELMNKLELEMERQRVKEEMDRVDREREIAQAKAEEDKRRMELEREEEREKEKERIAAERLKLEEEYVEKLKLHQVRQLDEMAALQKKFEEEKEKAEIERLEKEKMEQAQLAMEKELLEMKNAEMMLEAERLRLENITLLQLTEKQKIDFESSNVKKDNDMLSAGFNTNDTLAFGSSKDNQRLDRAHSDRMLVSGSKDLSAHDKDRDSERSSGIGFFAIYESDDESFSKHFNSKHLNASLSPPPSKSESHITPQPQLPSQTTSHESSPHDDDEDDVLKYLSTSKIPHLDEFDLNDSVVGAGVKVDGPLMSPSLPVHASEDEDVSSMASGLPFYTIDEDDEDECIVDLSASSPALKGETSIFTSPHSSPHSIPSTTPIDKLSLQSDVDLVVRFNALNISHKEKQVVDVDSQCEVKISTPSDDQHSIVLSIYEHDFTESTATDVHDIHLDSTISKDVIISSDNVIVGSYSTQHLDFADDDAHSMFNYTVEDDGARSSFVKDGLTLVSHATEKTELTHQTENTINTGYTGDGLGIFADVTDSSVATYSTFESPSEYSTFDSPIYSTFDSPVDHAIHSPKTLSSNQHTLDEMYSIFPKPVFPLTEPNTGVEDTIVDVKNTPPSIPSSSQHLTSKSILASPPVSPSHSPLSVSTVSLTPLSPTPFLSPEPNVTADFVYRVEEYSPSSTSSNQSTARFERGIDGKYTIPGKSFAYSHILTPAKKYKNPLNSPALGSPSSLIEHQPVSRNGHGLRNPENNVKPIMFPSHTLAPPIHDDLEQGASDPLINATTLRNSENAKLLRSRFRTMAAAHAANLKRDQLYYQKHQRSSECDPKVYPGSLTSTEQLTQKIETCTIGKGDMLNDTIITYLKKFAPERCNYESFRDLAPSVDYPEDINRLVDYNEWTTRSIVSFYYLSILQYHYITYQQPDSDLSPQDLIDFMSTQALPNHISRREISVVNDTFVQFTEASAGYRISQMRAMYQENPDNYPNISPILSNIMNDDDQFSHTRIILNEVVSITKSLMTCMFDVLNQAMSVAAHYNKHLTPDYLRSATSSGVYTVLDVDFVSEVNIFHCNFLLADNALASNANLLRYRRAVEGRVVCTGVDILDAATVSLISSNPAYSERLVDVKHLHDHPSRTNSQAYTLSKSARIANRNAVFHNYFGYTAKSTNPHWFKYENSHSLVCNEHDYDGIPIPLAQRWETFDLILPMKSHDQLIKKYHHTLQSPTLEITEMINFMYNSTFHELFDAGENQNIAHLLYPSETDKKYETIVKSND